MPRKRKEAKPKPVTKAEPKPKAKDEPKPVKGVTFRYVGKNAGRFVGKEFFPHPEYGTVMIPAAEGDQRVQVAKGETYTATNPEVIKTLDRSKYWERV